jgi:hypothetical protein
MAMNQVLHCCGEYQLPAESRANIKAEASAARTNVRIGIHHIMFASILDVKALFWFTKPPEKFGATLNRPVEVLLLEKVPALHSRSYYCSCRESVTPNESNQ